MLSLHPILFNTRNFLPILPEGLTAEELANRCRSAALGFIAGASNWDKKQLADWLENSYRPVTLGMPSAAQPTSSPAWGISISRLVRSTRPVDVQAIGTIIDSASAATVGILRSLQSEGGVAQFGSFAIRSNLVTRCIDDEGNTAWAPRASSKIKLADRVLSLFAADCLVRPWEYESSLSICDECNAVRLVDGEASCDRQACCGRTSGVMIKGARGEEDGTPAKVSAA